MRKIVKNMIKILLYIFFLIYLLIWVNIFFIAEADYEYIDIRTLPHNISVWNNSAIYSFYDNTWLNIFFSANLYFYHNWEYKKYFNLPWIAPCNTWFNWEWPGWLSTFWNNTIECSSSSSFSFIPNTFYYRIDSTLTNWTCWTNAISYLSWATSYSWTFCTAWILTPTNPGFPLPWQTINWTCQWSNWWTTESCSATKMPLTISSSKLKQFVKLPEAPELPQQEIWAWSKVWKFQSGSWVILSAYYDNNTNMSVNFEFEVYRLWEQNPVHLFESEDISTWTWKVEVPFSMLWVWEYFWKARVKRSDWAVSNWVDYNTNYVWEYDFSYFSGFEPYPYGYKFVNGIPDFSLLTWDYTYDNNVYTKISWTKWEIMDKVFPISVFNSEDEYYDAFDLMWLNNNQPKSFAWWNCFWLSFSALAQYIKPNEIANKFPEFSNNIWTWFIWNKINISTTKINNKYIWNWLDNNIKTILALQLYQYEENYSNLLTDSYSDTYIWILNTLKNNPDKNYILTFKWKDDCNILWLNCSNISHAVVPYKLEWNRIYIWDNNYPSPYFNYWDWNWNINAYENYIEINPINNSVNIPLYNWNVIEDVGIVDLDEIYSWSTTPIWFNGIDTVYTINWTSEILLTDTNWKRTWYKDWKIYEEIPWVYLLDWNNNFKQIYLPKKIEDLKIEIVSKLKWKYDFIIAWWDYFTKISWIETNSWQVDKFTSSRQNLEISFDKRKTWTYDLKINYYKDKWNFWFYKKLIKSTNSLQKYSIDWNKVKKNDKKLIKYQIDENWDWSFDKESYIEWVTKSK